MGQSNKGLFPQNILLKHTHTHIYIYIYFGYTHEACGILVP